VRAHVLFSENKPPALPDIDEAYRLKHNVDADLMENEEALKRQTYLALYRKVMADNKQSSSLYSTTVAPIEK
jgi:hypothetical protein